MSHGSGRPPWVGFYSTFNLITCWPRVHLYVLAVRVEHFMEFERKIYSEIPGITNTLFLKTLDLLLCVMNITFIHFCFLYHLMLQSNQVDVGTRRIYWWKTNGWWRRGRFEGKLRKLVILHKSKFESVTGYCKRFFKEMEIYFTKFAQCY